MVLFLYIYIYFVFNSVWLRRELGKGIRGKDKCVYETVLQDFTLSMSFLQN